MSSLRLENLTVSYNRVPAVHHVSFELGSGVCAGLAGPNGAGKTTLLKALAGLLRSETGDVWFDGNKFTPAFRRVNRHLFAYVPQREAVDWDFPITVRGMVEMGRYPSLGAWRRFAGRDDEIVNEALCAAGLLDFAERQIKQLSGGQQQRAFLARALAQQSQIYLLDEPFTGLDTKAAGQFVKTLHALRDRGKIIIASHHGLQDFPAYFDRMILLNGELIAEGPPGELFSSGAVRRAFDMEIFSGGHPAHEDGAASHGHGAAHVHQHIPTQ